MKISEKKIVEIAEELDVGMECYYHLKTGIITAVIHSSDWYDGDNPWQDDLDEIKKNRCDYFKFEKISSRDSFNIMADFVEIVEDKFFKEKLIHSLNRSKPFRNFKWNVENSDYREEWFDFKKKRYIEFVREQADFEN